MKVTIKFSSQKDSLLWLFCIYAKICRKTHIKLAARIEIQVAHSQWLKICIEHLYIIIYIYPKTSKSFQIGQTNFFKTDEENIINIYKINENVQNTVQLI